MGERYVTHHSSVFDVVFILSLLLFIRTVVPFNIDEAERFLNQANSPTDVDADSETELIDVEGNDLKRENRNQKDTTSQGIHEERVRRKREPISTTIGVISGLMTGFDFIWNKHPGPSPVGHVLPTLQEMQWRLIAVDFEFEELKNHSSLLHTKTQLYESDRDIRDSLDYSVAAASTKSNESVTQFLRKAERLESAINVLVDGMLGNGLNGSDILVNLRDAKDDHARNFLSAAHAFRNLTAIANTVLAAYYVMKKTDQAHVDHWRGEMLEKEKLIDERISQIEIDCQKEGNAKKYMERILTVSQNETTGQVAQRLYNELSDRYDTSLWLVVVYPTDIPDSHKYAVNNLTRRMHHVLDVGGKNAVANAFSHSDVATNQTLCRLKIATYENRVGSLPFLTRLSYLKEVFTWHFDSELPIKEDDVVVTGFRLNPQINLLEIRHSPSICYYSADQTFFSINSAKNKESFSFHLLIVPGAKPPLLPGWDDFVLRGVSSVKKYYTRFGDDCNGPCSNEGGRYTKKYFWCKKTEEFYNRHRPSWDYCSPRKDVTIYNDPCDDACEQRGDTDYFWCHRKKDIGGWNYCSPFRNLTLII